MFGIAGSRLEGLRFRGLGLRVAWLRDERFRV